MDKRGDFFSEEKGESTLNMGKPFLIGVANQINNIRLSEREALRYKGDEILKWLTELQCFYDMIESQLKIRNSKVECDLFGYEMVDNKLTKIIRKVKENEKFPEWFEEILKMYERVGMIMKTGNPSEILIYNKYKKILVELSKVTRELYAEADKRKLIMPNVKMDMKELAKAEWIDREFKKDF